MTDSKQLLPDGVLSPRNVLERLARVTVRQVENKTAYEKPIHKSTQDTWAKRVNSVHSALCRKY